MLFPIELWHPSIWEVRTLLFRFWNLLIYFEFFYCWELGIIPLLSSLLSDWARTLVKGIRNLWIISFGSLRSFFLASFFCVKFLIFFVIFYFLFVSCFNHSKRVCCLCEICLCLSEFPWFERVVGRRSFALN